MLKIKSIILLTALMLSMSMPILLAKAQPPSTGVTVYAWVDKPEYMPGDTGTLYITVRNDKPTDDIIIKNITIDYPWVAYLKDHWEGNETIKSIDAALGKGKAWSIERTFTVPKDGRILAYYGNTIDITVYVLEGSILNDYQPSSKPYVNIVNPSFHATVKDLDKILTMLTVAALLVIVGAVIVAAAVIVAGRGRRLPTE